MSQVNVEETKQDGGAEAAEDSKIQGHYHYKYDLMLKSDLDKKYELQKYLLSIPPRDWAQIVFAFTVFYGLLIIVFVITILGNVAAKGEQCMWAYFGMMVTTLICIIIAVILGQREKAINEAKSSTVSEANL